MPKRDEPARRRLRTASDLRFGFHDGYALGVAGGWNEPLASMNHSPMWLRRYGDRERRMFARGFACGAARRMKWEESRDTLPKDRGIILWGGIFPSVIA